MIFCFFFQGYGMSELGHLTTGGGSGGVLGAPIRGVRIKVVDTETGEVRERIERNKYLSS